MSNDKTQTTERAFDVGAFNRDLAAFAPVRTQARRLIVIGMKAGKPWDAATTVGEVAKASGTDPSEVVRLIRNCGWLMDVSELPGKAIEEWGVWEDGE